ncbi:uncharacterized protein, partial [Temnothorax nylanderi]|uniref:uncharacterized protein n=1 Tax=Temnothorax nylanderi TaxID=102681 RepID=UPI003A880821
LISNPELSLILTTDEMNTINDVFLRNIEFCPKCLPQSAFINKNSKTSVCIKETWYDISRFDHAVYKALKILDKRIDVLHTSPRRKQISMTSALFLCHINYFLEHVSRRMYFMPAEGRSKELHYRKFWHCQKKSIEDVARFTMDLERQRINHRNTLEDIVKRCRKNTVAIDGIDKRCNEYVTNTNTRYEKKQIAVWKAWEYERNELQVALGNVTDDLEFLKDVNTKLEQTIRKRKLTTESKLLAIMIKYDTEIGGRCKTLEELSEVYKYNELEKHDSEVTFFCIIHAIYARAAHMQTRRAEKVYWRSNLTPLQKEMKRQEEAYLVFIKRKEKTGITYFYKSLAMFERAHSARIIQRWWRKIFSDREGKEEVEKEKKVIRVYFTLHQSHIMYRVYFNDLSPRFLFTHFNECL